MMRSLLEKYRLGMITDDHLVVESLHMLDPKNPGLVLGSLPENILQRMLRFAKEYRENCMLTNYGPMPTQDQVRAASRWIEEALHQKANKTA